MGDLPWRGFDFARTGCVGARTCACLALGGAGVGGLVVRRVFTRDGSGRSLAICGFASRAAAGNVPLRLCVCRGGRRGFGCFFALRQKSPRGARSPRFLSPCRRCGLFGICFAFCRGNAARGGARFGNLAWGFRVACGRFPKKLARPSVDFSHAGRPARCGCAPCAGEPVFGCFHCSRGG